VKLLLDTNILIPSEPTDTAHLHPDTEQALKLAQLSNRAAVQSYVHPALLFDIDRDTDASRRELRGLQFRKYPELAKPPAVSPGLSALLGPSVQGDNDWVDHQLLAALDGDAVDYLITNDRRLHAKAQKALLKDRILTLAEAIGVLQALFDKIPVPPPAVRALTAYQLSDSDPIFDSFREDYADYDDWLSKCKREHRKAWMIEGDESRYAAICIVNPETDDLGLRGEVLKVCSLKVAEAYAGLRYGELLLKTVFHYAGQNSYDWLYITVFEKYDVLLRLLQDFGFSELSSRTTREELQLIKPLSFQDLDEVSIAPLEFNIRYGPFAVKFAGVDSYIVPIRPEYHRMLFPDAEEQLELMPGRHGFGNSIRKAYLYQAPIRAIKAGDILFFYKSGDTGSMTTFGVSEATLVSAEADEIARFVGKRTVYSYREIQWFCETDVLAILFRHAGVLKEPIPLPILMENGVLARAPQSIQSVRREARSWLYAQVKQRLPF
jgi:GNAT superfamily N-acetyltransferase